MHNTVRTAKILFGVSAACLLVHALSFVLMPFASASLLSGGGRSWYVVSGCMFWLGLVLGYLLFIAVNTLRKRMDTAEERQPFFKNGLFRFFSNIPAKIADVLLAVSVVMIILCLVCRWNTVLTFSMFSLGAFTFHMHGFLNGVNFRFMIKQDQSVGGTAK